MPVAVSALPRDLGDRADFARSIPRLVRAGSVVNLLLMALVVEEELRTTYIFMCNASGEGDARLPLKARLHTALQFLKKHHVHVLMLAYLFVLIGAVFILGNVLSDPHGGGAHGSLTTSDWFRAANVSDATLAVMSALDVDAYENWPIVQEGQWPLMYMVQAGALLVLVVHLMSSVFMPIERLNVLLNTIYEMVINDLSTYMTVFLWLFTGFYLALYILYPRSGEATLPHVASFNSVYTSVPDLLRLSILGEGVDFIPLLESYDAMSSAQLLALYLWLLLYYAYLLLSVILMINLLIAMLTSTYDNVHSNATLNSRLSFATGVMRLELIADSFGWPTAVGELDKGKLVYVFRTVSFMDEKDDLDEIEIGAEEGGGTDPFAPPPKSETGLLFDFVKDSMARLEARMDALDPEAKAQRSSGREEPSSLDPQVLQRRAKESQRAMVSARGVVRVQKAWRAHVAKHKFLNLRGKAPASAAATTSAPTPDSSSPVYQLQEAAPDVTAPSEA